MMASPRTLENIVPWTRLDWPLDWGACFDRPAPLHVELGFGDGEYLERSAAAASSENWVGVEVSWFSMRRMLRRLERTGLNNVRLVQCDAGLALQRLFPDASLCEITVNHSDPWPKKRHHERRLVQPGFLSVLASRLAVGGRATIVTDHAEYADWIAGALARTPELRSVFPSERVHELPGRPPTRYERKGRAAGATIHYFVWEKVLDACPAPARMMMRCETMPNVLLQGPLAESTLLHDLIPPGSPLEVTHGTLRIQLLCVYRRSDGEEWLVEGRIEEDGFVQHLAISVVGRPGNRWLLKPSTIGFPRPTSGVREAVFVLAQNLLRLNPGLRVVASGVGDLTQAPGQLQRGSA
jgi:tRNA (guanine-N7-)-methyltransferase